MSDSNTQRTINAMVRGIFLGGGLGAIVGWTGLVPLGRAVGLGMLCGVFAALTFKDRMETRSEKKRDDRS